jgi:hypothetical protein
MRMLDRMHADDEILGWREVARAEEVVRSANDTVEGANAFFKRREPTLVRELIMVRGQSFGLHPTSRPGHRWARSEGITP